MTDTDVVLYSESAGIATLTLHRPEALNAINRSVLEQLSAALDKVKASDDVQAAIITGFGEKAFSAGADISFLHTAAPLEARDLALLAVAVNRKVESLGKVVVAAINGSALGGGLELAEACALRVCASHAKLGHPEVKLGAVAGFGGTTRLPRLIGTGRAAELLLTGKTISAEEAWGMGLVNRVVDRDRLLAETESMLREIMSQAPVAVRMTWDAIHRGANLTPEQSALLGADCFGLAAATEDYREGTGAFLEKRRPSFKGK